MTTKSQHPSLPSLSKRPTGITGLDEITQGGLPTGRPTLICGQAGCGKTLMSIEFIVKGATLYNEPGVFMAFEEQAEELALNVSSLGFDLEKLQNEKKIKIDHVHIDRSEIEETGEYDLDGLFIRLGRGDQIFAIPTLVRRVPVPIRKIIGDLSNKEKVLVGLNIIPSV